MIKLLDIQRMSSEDGPGLRTTAFFKGCSLACTWCHNPESIAAHSEVLWYRERCMACASCVAACPHKGVSLEPDGLVLDREKCQACFSCVDACPTAALDGKGREITPEDLAHELLKDTAYWGEDGGVTLSGGEALLQEDAVKLLSLLKEAHIQTAVDTCGAIPTDRLKHALRYTDIVLYDLKLANTETHKTFTNAGNEQVLRNLAVVLAWAAAHEGRLWIRTPIISGATDTDENIAGIARILSQHARAIERWELCAFNNLGASKYVSLDRTWEHAASPLMRRSSMLSLVEVAQAQCAVKDIRATGAMSD